MNETASQSPGALRALFLFCVFSMTGCCTLCEPETTPEGKWECKSEWSNEKEGVAVASSVVSQTECKDQVLTVSGVLSIGEAKWSEKKAGTCFATGDELHGTWIVSETVAKNDQARRFEEERLGGKTLGEVSGEAGKPYSVRVTSRTPKAFEAIDPGGKKVSCTKL